MDLSLSPEQQKRIEALVASGAYNSPEAVIEAGLNLVAEKASEADRRAKRIELERAIEVRSLGVEAGDYPNDDPELKNLITEWEGLLSSGELERLKSLRTEIQAGIDSANRGELYDADEVFDEILSRATEGATGSQKAVGG
jgi:Arc/MetJ-type ribon-helix-helix transcriptional regulator